MFNSFSKFLGAPLLIVIYNDLMGTNMDVELIYYNLPRVQQKWILKQYQHSHRNKFFTYFIYFCLIENETIKNLEIQIYSNLKMCDYDPSTLCFLDSILWVNV